MTPSATFLITPNVSARVVSVESYRTFEGPDGRYLTVDVVAESIFGAMDYDAVHGSQIMVGA